MRSILFRRQLAKMGTQCTVQLQLLVTFTKKELFKKVTFLKIVTSYFTSYYKK